MLNCSNKKKDDTKIKYYDWNNMLSYDKDITIVVGEHGAGKKHWFNKNKVENKHVELQ